jgi:hypothetical protein
MAIDRKLVMCLIWRVIDYGNRSKTHHVSDMASYRLWKSIDISSCV